MHDQDTPFVDFAAVKSGVSIETVLKHYGVDWLKRSGDELRGKCPFHTDEGQRSFHANVVKNNFQCFSCKAKGNVLDFVTAQENCSIKRAAYLLATTFNVAAAFVQQDSDGSAAQAKLRKSACISSKTSAVAAAPALINPPLQFQLRLDQGHEYGTRRGLTSETTAYFGCGLCLSKGRFADRYLFPLHDADGCLVGYAGRALTDRVEPKYLFPPPDKHFSPAHLVFNLHRVKDRVSADDPVVVVEGLFGCALIQQAGFASVALLGSSLSEAQEHLLVQHFNHLILCFDGDKEGKCCAEDSLRRLARSIYVHVVDLPDGVQPDKMKIEEIKERIFCP